MCQQFHYPRPNRINVIGKDLINMSVNQMNRLIPNGGDQIHAQFQVWRIAFDSYQSQHPCQPTTATPTHHNMHMPMSTSLMSTPPPVPTATDFLNTYNPDATQNGFYNNMNKFGDDMNNMTKFREDNMKYNEMAKYNEQNKYNEYSMVKNEYYEHNQMPQEIYSPSASSSESITDDETQHDLQFEHHEGQGQVPMCVPQQMMSYQQQCQQRFSYMNVTPQHSHFQQPNFMQHHQFPAPAQPDFNAKQGINQANSGRTVHLWHFIKELLENPTEYSTCVRWVDREEGTFKIESSMQLARYWGIRKHREKMNYDKLSRSLRQYYKKGIIQKPEKKQRLVYKFLPPYSHWRPQLS
ncbi:unnamed protein product [Bursaphelenchus okinawaensis]|uniref:ETS domain-containing protein n=1 Tax=Bursaphelenchus okinawaensis TaxID=465554 RepID=A0A811KCJ4_9BILA|nr:unnamed protein product [Bursaphelenchus okinawaensis]CAG9101700.1 unnamed protein product [Bursaphelenchus okinawaensis]